MSVRLRSSMVKSIQPVLVPRPQVGFPCDLQRGTEIHLERAAAHDLMMPHPCMTVAWSMLVKQSDMSPPTQTRWCMDFFVETSLLKSLSQRGMKSMLSKSVLWTSLNSDTKKSIQWQAAEFSSCVGSWLLSTTGRHFNPGAFHLGSSRHFPGCHLEGLFWIIVGVAGAVGAL